jgi:hypothetical protein
MSELKTIELVSAAPAPKGRKPENAKQFLEKAGAIGAAHVVGRATGTEKGRVFDGMARRRQFHTRLRSGQPGHGQARIRCLGALGKTGQSRGLASAEEFENLNSAFQLISQSARIFMGNVSHGLLKIPQQGNLKLFKLASDLLLDQGANTELQFGRHLTRTVFLQPI